MTDASSLARLAALPVANVGDSMDRLGVVDAGIHAVWRGARVAGPAFTVEVAGGDNAGIHEALGRLRPGDVLVVNGHGLRDRALVGELIGERLRSAGCAGIVIDGALRDVDDLEEMGFPAFARAVTPAGPYRNGPYRIQVPVAIGTVVVSPGDIVLGDSDGLAIVPAAEASAVADRAEAKHADESATRASIVAAR
ncbi:RraA family protein [Clavibacter zhangzhiyongii]|jgi:regulator of RNase E activity RraA|uniref:Putative 4-hydroxy-4-methyl-2-oxoglutarate aldolase n=1 Tax=Clavibacter zhangzhiyongii TaxID=2768071 RepID=A0A7L7Z2Q8_9MICO|nr:methyltransferase [Clavibacter zhangzhiyongii]QOD43961.1 methyltransferase [Clavibacter zhangzhiyongii]